MSGGRGLQYSRGERDTILYPHTMQHLILKKLEREGKISNSASGAIASKGPKIARQVKKVLTHLG